MGTADTERKLDDLENDCIRQANVCPHWLPDGDAFWYIREPEAGKSEFIFVDCSAGTRQAAFDHQGLAAELSKHTEQEIDADALPFWWINIAGDGAWTRFQFDGQTWQYGSDRKLEIWDGDFDKGSFDEGCAEAASPFSRQQSSITFANHTAGVITYSWIGHKAGKPRRYGSVAAGQRAVQHSYAGHVWLLELQDSDKRIACAVKDKPSTAAIEELGPRLIIKWEGDEVDEGSNSSAVDASDSKSKPEAFIRDFNVWVKTADGVETPMSYDGFEDNEFREDNLYTSPDGRHVVVWQCKPESERRVHMVEASPRDQLHPKLSSNHYLKPGDNVERQRPRLFDMEACREVSVEDILFKNPYTLSDLGWSKDGTKYRFIFNERGHQHLRLLEIDLDGVVKALAEENSKTFVDYYHKIEYKMLEPTQELLWTSERDGWNHLYLIDLTDGTVKNQVTKGDWVVRSIESVDEDKRLVWFRGLGMVPDQDPYYIHLACVGFDGSGLSIVTGGGDGTHTWKWSPNKRFLVDSWSRVDSPPQTVLLEAQTGKDIVVLEHSRLDHLTKAGWALPERFVSPGRDGQTRIYGIIVRPVDFDSSKKYPVIEDIYAGPQDYHTPKAFRNFSKIRRRTGRDYVVVIADGMGTNWRSKAFHDVCYKNLKDAGFPDRIAWIRAAAAANERSWMDLSRVGCYGSSAGGQNAAAAVIHHSDFYKAACASAGCHDNRMDKLWWNELWMGYPVDGSYRESSNVTHAHKLGGALMLIVGGMDTNVDPSSTMQLVHALVEADKDFDFVYIPAGDHYVITKPFAMQKQDRFFKAHLLDS